MLSFFLFLVFMSVFGTAQQLIYDKVWLGHKQYSVVGHIKCTEWVAGVLTISDAYEKRAWVRKHMDTPHVFLIGSRNNTNEGVVETVQRLRSEIDTYRDIVVYGVAEQYNSSLTQKVQGFFQTIFEHCPNTKYFLKTDDDVWFDTAQVREEVETLVPPVYYGRILYNQSVHKNPSSKYYNPHWHGDRYPPYASGWGYVLDRNAVRLVIQQANTSLGPMEDVHTGILLQHVAPVHTTAFYGNVRPQTFLKSPPCVGGIGNRMFFWASTMGIANQNNLSYCVYGLGPETWLEQIFTIDVQERCPDSQVKYIPFSQDQTYKQKDMRVKQVGGMATETLGLIGYLQSFKYFRNIDVRSQLQFKPMIRKATESIFASRIPKAEHYVGIHIRRGDILRHGDRIFPPSSYFIRAMEHYRTKLGDDITFVVASDDYDWCNRQVFFKDAYILGNRYSATLDMALLASCNHTIMSIGTFGWWSAWLANGDVIYYADEFNMTHPDVVGKIRHSDYYPSSWIPLAGSKQTNTTLVTAYFPIESKHSYSQYLDWMRHLCSLFDPLVIMTTPNMTAWFKQCRQYRPTLFLETTLSELRYQTQQSSITYGADNPVLYHIWNQKTHWLKTVAESNPFSTSHFLWVDAGYFRNGLYDKSLVFKEFPFAEDKIFAMNITHVPICRKCVGLSAGIFGGTRRAIEQWHDAYYDIVHNVTQTIFQEQTHMYETCEANASLCRVVYPLMHTRSSPWFSLVNYFRRPLPIYIQGSVSVHGESIEYFGMVPDNKWVSTVLTMPSAVSRRNWVRATSAIPVVFLMGYDKGQTFTSLINSYKSELEQHKDILFVNVVENYNGCNNSLPRKNWAAFHAIFHNAPSVEFVQKTDHDVWSEYQVIQREVENLSPSVYYGKVFKNKKNMPPSHKNHIPVYKSGILPDFCSGWVYVLDRDFIGKMLGLDDVDLPDFYHGEDVFIGAVSKKLNVSAQHGSFLVRGDVPKHITGTPSHMHHWYHSDWGPEYDGTWSSIRYFGCVASKHFQISQSFEDRQVKRTKHSNITFLVISPNIVKNSFTRAIDAMHDEIIDYRDVLLISHYDANFVSNIHTLPKHSN